MDFKDEVQMQKAKRARKHSQYSASIWEQLYALVVRQWSMFWGDKFGLVTRVFAVVVEGIIYGTIFLNMPLTATGGFLRGGALLCAIVYNAFVCIQSSLFMSQS